MTLRLGIDDAGRGPVIGPMALAGVLIPEELEETFKELGIKDSKQVPAEKRKLLEKEIKFQAIDYHIALTSATELDNMMNSGTNLNKVEAQKAAEIINKLLAQLEDKYKDEKIKIIIDCPSTNLESWKDYLINHILVNGNIEISCEHKADINHIAVAAASILAKQAREAELVKLKKSIGKDFGSGYQTDPKTMKFLEEHSKEHEHDGIFRKSWQTWKNQVAKREQKGLL